MNGHTLLLSPWPPGCAWIGEADRDPRCPLPPIYELTCAYTRMVTQACVDHTAQMRVLHPDWISRIGLLAEHIRAENGDESLYADGAA